MFGRGNHLIRRGRHRLNNASEFCICPQCNFSIQHEQGMPCRSIVCPYCKIELVRSGANNVQNENCAPQRTSINSVSFKKNENRTSALTIKSSIDFPKVNTELCTGCGACVDVCPKNAIELVNGKATISEDKCRNCRICQRTCSVEAIS